ncbi:MAG: CDP-alcohol phosphatidyltransferase family protein, partial [Bauldia sp.]|nr:CDP-alcohol phosphatidyltransferase family protein [Bauldia sp.]
MQESQSYNRSTAGASHAWSLPNLLTYGRILAVPALVLFFYIESSAGRWLSFAVFVAASVSDFFDGYLARVWKQQSTLGRMLDPIADKLLVATSLLLLASDRTIGGWSLLA